MRRTMASPSARAALTSLCAACARKKRLGSTTIASRAAAVAARAYSTTHQQLPPPPPPPRRPSPHSPTRAHHPKRWLSSSSSSSNTKPLPPYYALFPRTLAHGAPPQAPFTIDTPALHREFLQLQAASHPDFHSHASATPGARRRAEGLSARINDAYATLRSPLLRAQYLLAERYGIDLARDEASAAGKPPDEDLLRVVWEAREDIEDAGSSEHVEEVRARNETRIRACLEALERAFAQEDVDAAVAQTKELKFWFSIRQSVDNWEPKPPELVAGGL